MRYDLPHLVPGWLHDGAQTSPDDHFGGAPWGFPLARWPTCRACGASLTFMAQFRHHPARLDLGGDGRILYLFWCTRDPGACEIWEPEAGCNAALILDPMECTSTSDTPDDVATEPYVLVVSWSEHDDGVPAPAYHQLFDPDAALHVDTSACRIELRSRLGGAPHWPQGVPMHVWDPSWRLAAQLSEGLWMEAPCPTPDQLGCAVLEQTGTGSTSVSFVRREPSARLPKAPAEVCVVDDGSWCIGHAGSASIFVFVRTSHGTAEARISIER